MEIYSPKKFQTASFKNNSEQVQRDHPQKGGNRIGIETNKKEKRDDDETISERMKRIFYERLKAFFEYEEVS